MVKGIILDVDGVIIGEKTGFNFPNPNPLVIDKLKQIRQSGIPIALCTAKPSFAIKNLVKEIGLDNYHIADGGGLIINPVQNKIVVKNLVNSQLAKEVIDFFLKSGVYLEFYTLDNYVIQKNQLSYITEKHTPILFQDPKVVESLTTVAGKSEITKFMLVAKDESDKLKITKLLKGFEGKLNIYWGVHPSALPLQFCVLTNLGVSKEQGAIEISKNINVPFSDMLGVGDTKSDWAFIELCQYGAAMGNASDELKQLVKSKGEKFYYIGPGVNENGIIEILDFFLGN